MSNSKLLSNVSIEDFLNIQVVNKAGPFDNEQKLEYSIEATDLYNSNHKKSLITREDLDKCYTTLQKTIKDLNKHIKVDACLDLGNNPLTDTSDLSITGKALDTLVYSCKSNLKPLVVVIINCSDDKLNGLWKLTPKMGKIVELNTIPSGCCYIYNNKIYQKKSQKLKSIAATVNPNLNSIKRNSMVKELDHSVERLASELNKIKEIQANISVSIDNYRINTDYVNTTIIDQSNNTRLEGIEIVDSNYMKLTCASVFNSINVKNLECDSGRFRNIQSDNIASTKINAKYLYINGKSVENRLTALEEKLSSIPDLIS